MTMNVGETSEMLVSLVGALGDMLDVADQMNDEVAALGGAKQPFGLMPTTGLAVKYAQARALMLAVARTRALGEEG